MVSANEGHWGVGYIHSSDEVKETSNHADENVFKYEYDYTIKNYGGLNDLVVECCNFLDYMKDRPSYENNTL